MRTVIFKLNYKCNADCVFCEVPRSNKMQSEPELKTRESELDSLMQEDTEDLVITGGEPAIYPGILEFVRYARKKYDLKNIYIQTNGLILANEQMVKKLMDAGINCIQISFNQTDPLKYDHILGIRDSLRYIKKGISNVRKNGLNIISNTVINRFNYQEIPDIVSFLISNDIRSIMVSSLNPIGTNLDSSGIPKSAVRYSEIIPYVEKALEILDANRVKINLKDFPVCMFSSRWQKSDNFIVSGKILLDLSFTRLDRCKECRFQDCCLGIRTSYLNIYGDSEFRHLPHFRNDSR